MQAPWVKPSSSAGNLAATAAAEGQFVEGRQGQQGQLREISRLQVSTGLPFSKVEQGEALREYLPCGKERTEACLRACEVHLIV